ncbi:hypothetical protein ACFL37_02650 [Candidatus Margulisiibacteriota bacterium]
MPAQARIESMDYAIPSLVFPSGGDESLEAGDYKLHDVKGQGVVGYGDGMDYSLGLGGIYTLALGPRIIEGDWPYGTVPLNISRVGSNIQITWDPMFRDPQIYVRVGDGSGQYTDTYNSMVWVPASDPSRSGEFDDVSDLADNELVHNNQVGDASTTHPEVYYKALQAGVTTNMRDPVSFQRCIEIAWAVGKVDLLMSKGWNSVSTALSAEAFGGAAGVAGDNFGEGSGIIIRMAPRTCPNSSDSRARPVGTIRRSICPWARAVCSISQV